jgi:hypothetical protein
MEMTSPKSIMIDNSNPDFNTLALNKYISVLVSAIKPELINTPAIIMLIASNIRLKDILLRLRSNLLGNIFVSFISN